MARENYSSSSPYFDTTQTSWYLLPWTPRTISADSTDVEFTVPPKYEHRPDLLSYDLYESPAYWWVFLLRNMDKIRDPIWDLKSGVTIKAPTLEHLKKLLG